MIRSKEILDKPVNSGVRSLFKAVGLCDDELEKPMIGIANSWSDMVPGHKHFRELAENVKYGILENGGYPLEFGVIGACDGIANSHIGMNYILPTREIIADSIECMAEANHLDGLVLLGGCDKIIPGMIMGAARLNIPAVILTGGPMLGGMIFDNRNSDNSSMPEAVAMLQNGTIDMNTFNKLEDYSCPTVGSCSFLGTANSMSCFAEALGLSVAGSSLIPAVYAERRRAAHDSGKAVMKLVKSGKTIKDVITKGSLCNAFKVMLAIGGSTNTVLHILGIAHSAGISLDINDLSILCDQIPIIGQVFPANKFNVVDLHNEGGIPAIMHELLPLLDTSAFTINNSNVGEVYKTTKKVEGAKLIRTIDDPFKIKGGIEVLKGNLAPNTGITKPAAIDPSMYFFEGKAVCFNSEEDAETAIIGGVKLENKVIVIRYEGPKGGPGMREMAVTMKMLYGRGLNLKTALITDGRFSGSNNGCFVGHISPEASEGGPIALVQDGDIITIDIPNKSLSVNLSEEEMDRRRKVWKPIVKDIQSPVLKKFMKYASSADRGAIIE